MSIRSNALPMRGDLAPELQDLLRRNGMQAHVIRQGDGFLLAVQGHDSPLLTYPISSQQFRALTDWGSNHANKTAYDTFASLVEKDFHMPRNFVHARNANGRVAMGLHGYRIGIGEYGRIPWDRRGIHPFIDPYRGRFLGWTPRNQEGFHMRRVGGALFMQEAPIIPERPDGRMKPGELQNGGYGFYYKGQRDVPQTEQDVLRDLQGIIAPMEPKPRTTEPAKPYSELITSNVYFSDEKWQECLSSHGIIIDSQEKTLTLQSSAARQDFVYDLTDEEAGLLTSNSIKDVPLKTRLDLINGVIGSDFQDKVTLEMLNSREQVTLRLHPAVEQEVSERQQAIEEAQAPIVMDGQWIPSHEEDRRTVHVDGQALYGLNENKGWFREGRHGREVMVDDIKVEPVRDSRGEQQKDGKGNALFRMTAVINGERISHEITRKQYDKFLAIDDYHRMKLFSHIFPEVDMKSVPGAHNDVGARIGGALLAGLAVMGELAHGHCAPSVFVEHHHDHEPRPHVYFKPGVDSPQELAARAFDAGLNAGEHGVGLGHNR